MDQKTKPDRYVSFRGLDCDQWADELYERLKATLESGGDRQWQEYFAQKFEEQARMKHDNLFFVGSQMNNLYSFFEEVGDDLTLGLIWRLEQECC
jgi:hypothetical protein